MKDEWKVTNNYEMTDEFTQEKKAILETLEEVMQGDVGGYQKYFKALKCKISQLFLHKLANNLVENEFEWAIENPTAKDMNTSTQLQAVYEYFIMMKENPELFCQEPKVEIFDEQEILWPTDILLWQDDIERIVENLKMQTQ